MSAPVATAILDLSGVDGLALFGPADANLRALERRFSVTLGARGQALSVTGPAGAVDAVSAVLRLLCDRVRGGRVITDEDLGFLFSAGDAVREGTPFPEDSVVFFGDKRVVKARTVGQAAYVDAMRRDDIVFGIGPAGTGKTYLAVAMAMRMLKDKHVERVILARPAVLVLRCLLYRLWVPEALQELRYLASYHPETGCNFPCH